MRSKLVLGLLMAGLAVALAACGGPAPTPPPSTVAVEVTLSEFSIESSLTTFEVGTPYHFVITDAGSIAHSFQIMPPGVTDRDQALAEVLEDELPPAATAEIDFTFTAAGQFEFSCLVPGHYEAGMLISITVQ